MAITAHIEMMQAKHGKLETMIQDELHRPSPDLALLQTLKKQKLLLKEEIERLRALMEGPTRLDAA